MSVDYSLPKPTAGSSRATSPTEAEIMADISDTIADIGTRLDAVENGASTVLIAETKLASPAASIDFGSIPATYRNLRLVVHGRGSAAASTVSVFVDVNGDTVASNYRHQRLSGTSTTAAATAADDRKIGDIAADNATAGMAGAVDLFIHDYTSTAFHKTMTAENVVRWSETAHLAALFGVWWESTVAINQLTVKPSSGNFAVGTVATLYGLSGN